MTAKLYTYLSILIQFLILLPSALLCYLPMKSRLRYSREKIASLFLVLFIPYAVIASVICLIAKIDTNFILLPSLALFFLFYRHTVTADFSCALAVFSGVCTLMSFPAQFAYGFDAWLHPSSTAADFSLWGTLFQLALCCLLVAGLWIPYEKFYPQMVERLPIPQVWYSSLAVHCILFLFNLLMIPHSYITLYTGRAFAAFLSLEAVLMLLFLFLHVIFHRIADVILRHGELLQRSRLLEMQADQYQALQNYIRQTRMLRHDFRQSIHILAALAEKGDLPGLRVHLREYEQQLDAKPPVFYCANTGLNALFNYYKGMADTHGIQTRWQISIPEPLTISELDLASLLGNLMENAIAGCMTVLEGTPRFALSVEAMQDNCLYIVSTNSFDGRVSKTGEEYLSTKHDGEGIGLLSIASVAKKYQGCAKVSHKGKEFFVDVMLKNG